MTLFGKKMPFLNGKILNGINEQNYNIIYSLYTYFTFKYKFANELSQRLLFTYCVKQGDVLTPILFSLFIDDLVKNLNSFF